ncbi:MAG: hypothetical protein H6744_21630 [Deltaproteobacteria bacterium]|nr:hypothetical protein [Deltaproteobacteria bacterium]MCB9789286.1 hypothetical protein [Deltaproteobacteria bacterium]
MTAKYPDRPGLDEARAVSEAFTQRMIENSRRLAEERRKKGPRKPGEPYWAEEDWEEDLDWGKDDHIRPRPRPRDEGCTGA